MDVFTAVNPWNEIPNTGVTCLPSSTPTVPRMFFQNAECEVGVIPPPFRPTYQLSKNLVPSYAFCAFTDMAIAIAATATNIPLFLIMFLNLMICLVTNI